ncbi:MAG TPA: PspC domain-containing protein [Flavobacterium sp.]|uniref:PspC domain-containing protein n=1 Tax=Flavobacterium sp. TaxID=239 RepID=UPI002BEEF162|nr:PspC domain-containing protein [Flavobacterium sp.]HNP33746.1 PspC domain-containing protein [Flavobacterium sp.]
MNKTVNINIGGLVFHIDEDAYQKLTRYFEAIKRSLSNSSGQDEIMKDIEMRVAELLAEKQKSDKHAINNKEVDEVIGVMGQPEDYRLDDEEENKTAEPYYPYTRSKKLYRDKDRGTIAGVCTGLGHYFGIDAVWLKILFLILFFGFGTGLLAYIILWIAMPKAITTSEKLEMTGEPVTISNIEKKVREEFDSVANKFKNADYDKMGNQVKNGAERVAGGVGEVLTKIFGAFAKVLGAFIVIFASLALLGICIGSVIMIFSSSMPENKIVEFISTPLGLETPLWAQGVLFLLAVGIPFFFVLILGLKLLVTNLKSIGNIAKYSLLAIWIIAVGILISLGINEFNQLAYSGKTVEKETIGITATDTIKVQFKYNDFYSKSLDDRDDIRIMQDSAGNAVIYSTNVGLHLKRTDKASPYIQIEKKANGKSFGEANERAQKIKYNFKIVGNELILDNYFLTDTKNKLRNQRVDIYLYLPEGIVYYPNANVTNYLDGSNSDFDYFYGPEGYKYKVESSDLKCLNCPDEDKDSDEAKTEDISVDENDTVKTVTVKVNGKTVTETKSGKPKTTKLTVGTDGVIIKTN